MAANIREEALLALQGRGAILDVAREVSQLLRDENIDGAVIGGVAVLLHGHIRTTVDVDIYVGNTERLAAVLQTHGFEFEPQARQFMKNDVPVHLVTTGQLKLAPRQYEDIEGIRTVSLADLINMKLRSGSEDLLRAQDLADVIGLIQTNGLTSQFAQRISKDLRPEFRKLVRAIQRPGGRR